MAGVATGAPMLHQPTAALSGAAAAAVREGRGTQHRTAHPSAPHILIIHLALPALLYPPLHPPCLISVNPLSTSCVFFSVRHFVGSWIGSQNVAVVLKWAQSGVGCKLIILLPWVWMLISLSRPPQCISVCLDWTSGKLGAAKKQDQWDPIDPGQLTGLFIHLMMSCWPDSLALETVHSSGEKKPAQISIFSSGWVHKLPEHLLLWQPQDGSRQEVTAGLNA